MKLNHPKGLYMLFTLEACERFSYYGMNAVLVLFMVSVLYFNKPFASQFYGFYGGLVYLTPLLGGYIADKFIGNRKSIIIGGTLMIIAQFSLAYSALFYNPSNVLNIHSTLIFTQQEIFFILGCLLMSIGNGFFKPNISSLVKFLYEKNDQRIDSAYTIFYMGINVGALLSPIIIGLAIGDGHPEYYVWAFIISGIVMMIGLILFILTKNKLLRDPQNRPIGVEPSSKYSEELTEEECDKAILNREEYDEIEIKKVKEKLKKTSIEEKRDILKNSPLTKVEKHRIFVILIFCFVAVFFDASFEQSGASLTFFTEQCVNRTVPMIGYTIPTPVFQSVDPIFVVILAPILIALFGWLASKNREPNIISKLGIGMLIMSIGFFILCIPGQLVDSGLTNISMLWIIGIYLIQALSELFVSPVGLSAVSKLSPIKFASLFMGVWFLETAIANVLAGWLSSFYPDPETGVVQHFLGIIPIDGFVTFFLIFAVSTLVVGIIVFIFKNKITAWMH